MNNIIVALIITLLIIIVFGFLIGLAFYEGDKFFDAATFYHGYEVAKWFEDNEEEVDMSKVSGSEWSDYEFYIEHKDEEKFQKYIK